MRRRIFILGAAACLVGCAELVATAIPVGATLLKVAAANYGIPYADRLGLVVDQLQNAALKSLGGDVASGPTLQVNLAFVAQRSQGLTALNDLDPVQENDQVRVYVKPSAPCYVYLVAIDASAKLNLIDPRSLSAEQPIGVGVSTALPDATNWLRFDAQKGLEHFILVASPKPFSSLATPILGLLKTTPRDVLADPVTVTEEFRPEAAPGAIRPRAVPSSDESLQVVSTIQLQDSVQYRVLGQPSQSYNAQELEPSLEDGYMLMMQERTA